MTKIIDKPFQSKADRALEDALTAQYRALGNQDIADAVRLQQQAEKPDTERQQR